MAKDYSPFTPGVPVSPELFAGKALEVERLIASCKAAQAGKFERTFVIGDRGIGKTSLCSVVRQVADAKLEMLTAHVFLGGVASLEEMARKLFEEIAKGSVDRPWYSSLAKRFGKNVKQVGLFGVSIAFQAPPEDLRQLALNMPSELRGLVDTVSANRKGLLLILDDINGLASSPEFANWLKSFVDTVATGKHSLPLHLVLAGLPERRESLVQLQPSLNRVFGLQKTETVSNADATAFFERTFSLGGVKLAAGTTELLVRYSGGYPAIMQEVGDAVFKADIDGEVSFDDVVDGVVSAAEVIGRKYFDHAVFDAIRSQRYLEVLASVSKGISNELLSRRQMIATLSPELVRVLDNFLRKMVEIGVLVRIGTGQYQFVHVLHRLYFSMEAIRRLRKIPRSSTTPS